MLQNGNHYKYFHGNIIIAGMINCKTGLHIGGSSDTIEIGGIDSLVVKNPLNHEPYIPGSSLKGKLRSILEKIVSVNGTPLMAQRDGGDRNHKVWRHECDDYINAMNCPLCRIFGSTGKDMQHNNFPAQITVRDGRLANPEEMEDEGIPVFEAKMENSLDRLTSAALPRCVERVPAGAKFTFKIIYRVEKHGKKENETDDHCNIEFTGQDTLEQDMKHILNVMGMLEYDGLGGNISRGYGEISFGLQNIKGLKSNGTTIAEISVPDSTEIYPATALNNINSFVASFTSGCNGETDENSKA